MKETKIKSINEYFSQTLGDSFNSSNGVFKVNYRTYSDLSLPVGRGPDPSLLIKDSVYKTGDIVRGSVKGMNKKIQGKVIETHKSSDGKYFIIKIQRDANNKIYTLIPGSIQFIEDRGNSINATNMNIGSREKNAQLAKYNGGNIVWGSLEGKDEDELPINPEDNTNIINGPMDTGWKIKFVDILPIGKLLFNSFVIDASNMIIVSVRPNIINEIKDLIKAAESYCFIFYHPDMKEYNDELKCLISILFLEMKNETSAKAKLIEKFSEISVKSYGEVRDENIEKAKSIINKFLY